MDASLYIFLLLCLAFRIWPYSKFTISRRNLPPILLAKVNIGTFDRFLYADAAIPVRRQWLQSAACRVLGRRGCRHNMRRSALSLGNRCEPNFFRFEFKVIRQSVRLCRQSPPFSIWPFHSLAQKMLVISLTPGIVPGSNVLRGAVPASRLARSRT